MKKVLLVLLALAITLLALRQHGTPPSSFAWFGAPNGTELEPEIKKAWMGEPNYFPAQVAARMEAVKGDKTSVETMNPKVGQERYGLANVKGDLVHAVSKDHSAEAEANTHYCSYWPVKVTLHTTYKSDASDPSKETITSQMAPYTCYAYKDNDGHWKVTFHTPLDHTPQVKIW